jgi:hypothetical protein
MNIEATPKEQVPAPMTLGAAALGLFAAAVLTGLAFAAWTSNGPALLNALAANGLAWCL